MNTHMPLDLPNRHVAVGQALLDANYGSLSSAINAAAWAYSNVKGTHTDVAMVFSGGPDGFLFDVQMTAVQARELAALLHAGADKADSLKAMAAATWPVELDDGGVQ